MPSAIMLSVVIYVKWVIMLSVVMLIFVMPIDFICTVVVLSTVILSYYMPRIIVLSAIMLCVVMLTFIITRVFEFYVEMLSVIMLSAVILIAAAPSICYHHLSFIVKGEASKGCWGGIHQTYL
jgi:hypothetical protein